MLRQKHMEDYLSRPPQVEIKEGESTSTETELFDSSRITSFLWHGGKVQHGATDRNQDELTWTVMTLLSEGDYQTQFVESGLTFMTVKHTVTSQTWWHRQTARCHRFISPLTSRWRWFFLKTTRAVALSETERWSDLWWSHFGINSSKLIYRL